ncbi:unnamed protein product [Ectocarpus sp. 8 AP-2014]
MRFTCSFVTSRSSSDSCLIWGFCWWSCRAVALRSNSAPRTCLPLPCPPTRGASSPRDPCSYAWPRPPPPPRPPPQPPPSRPPIPPALRAPETRAQNWRSPEAKCCTTVSGGLPMTSRSIQLHDVTTPLAARPPAAVCHPDAHDAIDMWVGQLEAILGELALHAQKRYTSPGALIGEGLHKIAAGISQGVTGKVPDA